jgi:hypothetical protein
VERLVGACRGALLLKNTNGETAADVRHLTAPAWPYPLSAGRAELFFRGFLRRRGVGLQLAALLC